MLVSPADFQAFAEATGTPYPSTGANKAQLLPLVAQWKAEQQQQATTSRGPNALGIGLGLLGAAGIGAAGLGLYSRLRRSGLSEEVAAQTARNLEVQAENSPQLDTAPTALYRGPNPVAVVRDDDGKIRYQTGSLSPGSITGTAEARRRGEYNLRSPWNQEPLGRLLRAATTPALQQQLLDQTAATNPELAADLALALNQRNRASSKQPQVVDNLNALPPLNRVQEGDAFYSAADKRIVVAVRGRTGALQWAGGDANAARTRLAATPQAAYGSQTSAENEALGLDPIVAPEHKNTSKRMLQPGYLPPDESSAAFLAVNPTDLSKVALRKGYGIDPELGVLTNKAGDPARFGERNVASLLNRPIRWSDLEGQPRVDGEQGAYNAYLDREDQTTRGMYETPPVTSADPKALRLQADYGWSPVSSGDSPFAPVLDTPGAVSVEEPVWVQSPVPDERLYRVQMPPLSKTNAYLNYAKDLTAAGVSPVRVEDMIARGDAYRDLVLQMMQEAESGSVAVDLQGRPIPWETIRAGKAKGIGTESRFYRWDEGYDRPMERALQLDAAGKPLMRRRPAAPQDLWGWQTNEGPDGSAYIGKTASEIPSGDLADDYISAKPTNTTLARAAAAFNALAASGVDQTSALTEVAARFSVPPTEIDPAAARLRGDIALPAASGFQAPAAHAVGGHSSRDWLTQVLSAMQVTPREDSTSLDALLRSDDPADQARAARSWLNANPELVEVLDRNLSSSFGKLAATEKLSLVQEALGDAAVDFNKAIAWAQTNAPELAERADPARPGALSFDQFARPYVRKHVLGAALEVANAGGGTAPVLNLPSAVSELIATKALVKGTTPDAVLNETIGDARSPVEALWKLDGLLADATSTNLDEPYTAGSKLAESFWAAADPADGTRAGALKARLGATDQSGYRSADPAGGASARLPIAIKFGSNIAGTEGGLLSADQAFTDALIAQATDPDGGIRSLDGADPATAAWLKDTQATAQARLDAIPPRIRQAVTPEPVARSSGNRRPSPLATAVGDGERQFGLNKRLDNLAKAANNEIARANAALKAGTLSPDDHQQIVATAEATIAKQARKQDTIDALRREGEQLLSRANAGAVVDPAAPAIGRGYVLDLDPRTGRARALPDSAITRLSFDALSAGGDSADDDASTFLAQDQRDELNREQSLVPADSPLDVAAAADDNDTTLRAYGHGTRNAALNFTSLGPGPDAASDGERNRAIAELHRQGYGPGYGRPAGTPLATPALALAVARAHLDRQSQTAPTPVHTLPAAAPGFVQAAPTDTELAAARNQHLADFITKVATPGFNSAGAQTSGWAGGDSWSGGARQAGRAAEARTYAAPSEALQRAIAFTARRRGGL